MTESYTSKIRNPEITVITRTMAGQRVFVGGEVNSPGIVPLLGEMNVLDAIMAAGGFDKTSAQMSQVVIVRHVGDKRLATTVDVKAILESTESDPFYLAANDIVFVPRTKINELNQWVDQHITKMIPNTSVVLTHRVNDRTAIGVTP